MSIDIATLGIQVDTSQVKTASSDLDSLTAASARTQAATTGLTGAAGKTADEIKRQTAAMQAGIPATQQAAVAIDRSSKSYTDLDTRLERFISTIDKTYAAQRNLDKGNDLLTEGLKKGVISQQTYDSALSSLTGKYSPAKEGAEKLGEAVGKAAIPTGLLTRELRALGDEAAAGRWRQFEGTSALLASRFLSLGPAGLAAAAGIVGVGAAMGLLIARQEALLSAIKGIEVGFAAVGNSTLLSEKQVRVYIDQLSLLPGVSKASAESIIGEFSRIPGLTKNTFDRSTAIVRDFSAALGVDTVKGATTLANALENPAQGIKSLDDKFLRLTLDQRLAADEMLRMGDKAGAVALILTALENNTKGLADRGLTPVGKAASDVGIAWERLMQSFGQSTPIGIALDKITALLNKVKEFVDFINRNKAIIGTAASAAAGGAVNAVVPGAGLIYNALPGGKSDPQGAVGGKLNGGTYNFNADGSLRSRTGDDASGVASQGATTGMSDREKALLDRGQKYGQSKKEQDAQLIADERDYRAELQKTNLSIEARTKIENILAAIQERRTKIEKTPTTPLGLNVDNSELQKQLHEVDAQSKQLRDKHTEEQKFLDFYHSVELMSDKDFYAAKINENKDFLERQSGLYDQQIADVQAKLRKLESLRPANQAQSDQLLTERNRLQTQMNDLVEKEAELRSTIASDNRFLDEQQKYLAGQKEYNDAIAIGQTVTAKLRDEEERASLSVQLGLKTQVEGTKAVIAARVQAIASLQKEEETLIRLRDDASAAGQEKAFQKYAKAVEQVDLQILKLQADLDPIAQRLDAALDTGLGNFLSKLESGVHSFKDLRAAAKAFFDDIDKAILKEVNQQISDSIMKQLGLKGGAGSDTFGSMLRKGMGLPGPENSGGKSGGAGAAADDPMGDFLKDLDATDGSLKQLNTGGIGGAIKSFGNYVEKLIFGTAAETTSASASTKTAGSLVSLSIAADRAAASLASVGGSSAGGGSGAGLLGGLFGGGGTGGTAGAGMAAGETGAFDMAGSVGAGLLHSGGMVGMHLTSRDVPMSLFANAPRLHTGGMLGYGERPTILKEGEEVLTDTDPRHRKNMRGGGVTNVTNNFAISGAGSDGRTQSQIANAAYAGASRARSRIS